MYASLENSGQLDLPKMTCKKEEKIAEIPYRKVPRVCSIIPFTALFHAAVYNTNLLHTPLLLCFYSTQSLKIYNFNSPAHTCTQIGIDDACNHLQTEPTKIRMTENSEVPLQTSKVKTPSAILLLCIPDTNTLWVLEHCDSMLSGIYLEVYSIEFSLT